MFHQSDERKFMCTLLVESSENENEKKLIQVLVKVC